jgi:GNAT superfamily N-acetyltransferase
MLERRGLLEGKEFICSLLCDRNFNFLRKSVLMGFWSRTTAAPSWWSTWGTQTPGYVRPEPPPLPLLPPPYSIKRLARGDEAAVAQLWRTHYGGPDWWFDADEALVLTYLNDPHVVLLGLHRGGALVATIAAVPFGETTTMSHGAVLEDRGFHVVEGLVVHGELRGQGVAGWMIAAIDGTMSRLHAPRPFACVWAREISTIPHFPTFVSCLPYRWRLCEGGASQGGASQEGASQGGASQEGASQEGALTAAAFQPLWDSLREGAGPFLATSTIDNRRGGLRFFCGGGGYAVVTDTRRRTTPGDRRIYEIAWASSADAVAAAAARLDGLLFTTMDMGEREGWSKGGYHAYSIYNYRPPAYGTCDIRALREEL